MVPILYIYCYWTWVITFLYLIRLFPYTPLLSVFIALIFTIYYNFLYLKTELKRSFIIISLELFIFILLLNNYTGNIDLKFNILLFLTYNLILTIYNKTFYQIYFEDIPKYVNQNNESYLNRRLSYLINMFRI